MGSGLKYRDTVTLVNASGKSMAFVFYKSNLGKRNPLYTVIAPNIVQTPEECLIVFSHNL